MSNRVLVKFEVTVSAPSNDEALRHVTVMQEMLTDYPAGLEEAEGVVTVLVRKNQKVGEKI
jgi:hypothetical protein